MISLLQKQTFSQIMSKPNSKLVAPRLAFQGNWEAYEKEYQVGRKETSERIERAINLYTDLLEEHFDELKIQMTTEDRDTSKSIRFHLSLPKAPCDAVGLVSGIQLGIGFNGTTGLFGFGKPIVNVFSFFYTQEDANAQFASKGMIDALDHTGLFTVKHKSGKTLNEKSFKPYQAGWLHRKKLGLERLFQNSYSSYELGSDSLYSELDKRQLKLMIRLLEKTQALPQFEEFIKKLKRQK
jgi:hypothetical protein